MQISSSVNLDVPSVRKILVAARGCFGREGYKGTSMSRMAREAGVSKSLLHYHFDSKEQLFVEVQLMLLRDLLDRIRSFSHGPATVEHFSGALDQVMAFIEAEVVDLRVLLEFHQQGVNNPDVALRLKGFNDEVSALVESGIRNVLGPMSDRMSIAPDRLARMLRTIFNGLIIELIYAPDEEAKELTRQTFQDVRSLITRTVFTEVS
ncbi:MAG: AcrR family transcriptional regulator [Myxococcota bacterium]|jgi:AcrR family transcriptional regulator